MWPFETNVAGGQITRSECLAYAVLGLIGLLFFGVAMREKQGAIDVALANYTSTNRAAVEQTANSIEFKFTQVHQGLRTIARLPGVRMIDRYGKSFNVDARTSVQEIYNNLAANVAVSEVYIVPLEFDPDALDVTTGKPQEPIITFDNLIVGRTADTEPLEAKGKGRFVQHAGFVEEVEIYEYRVMRRQIDFLKKRFMDESAISYSAYPAIGSEGVVTCDNTRYSPKSPDDEDRIGVVYSVPFYGPSGRMRGIVTAVILTRVIQEMLPDDTNAISNPVYKFIAGPSSGRFWRNHVDSISIGKETQSLLFSNIRKLNFPDLDGSWKLWTGVPNQRFWNGLPVRAAQDKARDRYLVIAITFALLSTLMRMMFVRHRSMVRRNAELEEYVEHRTHALAAAKKEAEEANNAKSRFLANMSHEIRTPLATMLGMMDLISQTPLRGSQTKQLGVARQAGRSLTTVIGQVLDISAIEAGGIVLNPQPISLSDVVNGVARLFEERAGNKGLNLLTNVDNRLPDKVSIDGGRLTQVLINLVGNAIKFTETGCVEINVKPGAVNDAGHQTIWLEVKDTGTGINPVDQDVIFDPFRQSTNTESEHYGGSGLGLSISRSLVTKMGGTLGFESVPDRGTTFFFTVDVVPLVNDDVAATADDEESSSLTPRAFPELDGAKILLAEDNRAMQELINGALAPQGCVVAVAENGQKAAELYAGTSFQLILMDCRMPEMDGFRATKIIRAQERETNAVSVPIIALTANAFEEDRKACLEAGMTDFLSKPFTALQLLEIVSKCLVEQRSS